MRSDTQGWSDGQGNSSQVYSESTEVVVEGWRVLGVGIYQAAMCAALWVILVDFERRAGDAGAHASADRLGLIRRVTVTVFAMGVALMAAVEAGWATADGLAIPVLATAIAGLIGAIWVVSTLYNEAGGAWARTTQPVRPTTA